MALNIASSTTTTANPIDLAEEIVRANEWTLERSAEDELLVEVSGQFCDYRLCFVWREDMSSLHFTCVIDARVPPRRDREVHSLLAYVNERLWLGHFDVCSEEKVPMFRQTVLLRGIRCASVEQIEDLMDIALNECERFYPAFQFVLWGGKSAKDALEAAMVDTVGEA